ncbi:MAG: hypothetical protein KDA32_10920 [Phycisphaerales bacterium]|nr:hypothetical protein [Phycisphaerales bacterium]
MKPAPTQNGFPCPADIIRQAKPPQRDEFEQMLFDAADTFDRFEQIPDDMVRTLTVLYHISHAKLADVGEIMARDIPVMRLLKAWSQRDNVMLFDLLDSEIRQSVPLRNLFEEMKAEGQI